MFDYKVDFRGLSIKHFWTYPTHMLLNYVSNLLKKERFSQINCKSNWSTVKTAWPQEDSFKFLTPRFFFLPPPKRFFHLSQFENTWNHWNQSWKKPVFRKKKLWKKPLIKPVFFMNIQVTSLTFFWHISSPLFPFTHNEC